MNAQLARNAPPAPFAPRLRPADHLFRAAAVRVIAHQRNVSPDEILKEQYADDRVTPWVIRAATSPATVGTAGSAWAGALAVNAVSDAIVGLAGPSAAASLIAMGLRISLSGRRAIQVPARLVTAADAGTFTAEGDPIAVKSLNVLGGPTLTPNKLGVIVAFTRELADAADFEEVAKQMLSEAAALALDAALFSATAGSAIRPPGIFNGVTAITAAAGGGEAALAKDIGALVNALAAAGAGKDVVFIAAPGQAASLKIWAGPKFDYEILASTALPAGQIIAIEAGSFVSAFSAVPEFNTSDEMVIHMEDTAPAQIVGPPGPATVATPTRSLWQTDCLALRLILRCGWGVRAAGHVQFISGTTW